MLKARPNPRGDTDMNAKYVIIAAAAVIMLAIGGYWLATQSGEKSDDEVIASDELKQLVLAYSKREAKEQSASITSHQLIVTNADQTQSTYALPEKEFFVSIAPYVEQTHPCAIHSLTGCQGELADEEFFLQIADSDGNVFVDKAVRSLANGFIDLWLPRDRTYNVRIEQAGKSAEAAITTFEGDNTCIATMQLS